MVLAVVLCSRSPAVPTGEATEGAQAWARQVKGWTKTTWWPSYSIASLSWRLLTTWNHTASLLQEPLSMSFLFWGEETRRVLWSLHLYCYIRQKKNFELRTLENKCCDTVLFCFLLCTWEKYFGNNGSPRFCQFDCVIRKGIIMCTVQATLSPLSPAWDTYSWCLYRTLWHNPLLRENVLF